MAVSNTDIGASVLLPEYSAVPIAKQFGAGKTEHQRGAGYFEDTGNERANQIFDAINKAAGQGTFQEGQFNTAQNEFNKLQQEFKAGKINQADYSKILY